MQHLFLVSLAVLRFQDDGGDTSGGGIAGALGGIIGLIVAVIVIAGLWKIFSKAGKPGWAAIIPIYNLIVLLQIVGRPLWWIILFLIPFVNFIAAIILYMDLAKSFGKGGLYGILMLILPFIFIPMLGFGSDQYVGPAAATPGM
jgi:hypothetical protein